MMPDRSEPLAQPWRVYDVWREASLFLRKPQDLGLSIEILGYFILVEAERGIDPLDQPEATAIWVLCDLFPMEPKRLVPNQVRL
jgi:hypothetical protein